MAPSSHRGAGVAILPRAYKGEGWTYLLTTHQIFRVMIKDPALRPN